MKQGDLIRFKDVDIVDPAYHGAVGLVVNVITHDSFVWGTETICEVMVFGHMIENCRPGYDIEPL